MKKGFTIVELMASIVIIGVISLLGVATYRNVSEKIKIQQYENKVTLIESKAALFATDTGFLKTNVNELICEGYLEYDEEPDETYDCGKLLNPINNTSLNENIIVITREGENFYGNFTEEKNLDINEVDRENINMKITGITTESKKNLDDIEKDDNDKVWTNENVNLTASITTEYDASKINKITWYNGAILLKECKFENNINLNTEPECNNISNSLQYTVEAKQILNTNYRVEVELETGSGEGITIYQASKIVRIDKQKPIVYKDETKVENADAWTASKKTTTILSTDQNGSGIAGYYVIKDSDYEEGLEQNSTYELNCSREKCNKEKYEVSKGNGTYYAFAKDNAGNISSGVKFKVEKIDDTPPTCTISIDDTHPVTIGNNGWYTSDVYFKIDGDDGFNSDGTAGSGVQSKQMNLDKIIDDTTGTQIKGVVRDKAGNKGECIYNGGEFVKIDTQPPKCELTGNKNTACYYNDDGTTNWQTGDYTVTYGCSDDTSQCTIDSNGEQVQFLKKDKTEVSYFTLAAYTIKDNAGHQTTCQAQNVYVCIDNKGPGISLAANKWKDNDVTPTPTTGLGGAYTSASWTKKNIYTKITTSENGSGLAKTFYTTTGETGRGDDGKQRTTRSIVAEGRSTIQYTACDKMGNCSKSDQLVVNVDKTKPTCSIKVDGDMKDPDSGWYTSDVYFEVSPFDPNEKKDKTISVSDIKATPSAPDPLTTDTSSHTVSVEVEDNAGNLGKCSRTVKRDATPPEIAEVFYTSNGDNKECINTTKSYFGVTYKDKTSKVGLRGSVAINYYYNGELKGAGVDEQKTSEDVTQHIFCVESGIVSWWLTKDITVKDNAGNSYTWKAAWSNHK